MPSSLGAAFELLRRGSYAIRTNVRQDSDVDVCILCNDVYIVQYPPNVTDADVGLVTSQYTYQIYRSEVEAALVNFFGRSRVRRGNKAFDIHENTYRVDADAVACFEYRHYYRDMYGQLTYHSGTALYTDREAMRVTNFPQQQYKNGVAKNDATGRRFKALVRIVKKLRNEMGEVGISEASPIASFLIESLVWNWPNELFDQPTYTSIVKGFLAYIWEATKTDEGCQRWMEENGIKKLFGPHNAWTRQQVHEFAQVAYGYIEAQ